MMDQIRMHIATVWNNARGNVALEFTDERPHEQFTGPVVVIESIAVAALFFAKSVKSLMSTTIYTS